MSKHFIHELWGAFKDGLTSPDPAEPAKATGGEADSVDQDKEKSTRLGDALQLGLEHNPELPPSLPYRYKPLLPPRGDTKNIRLLTLLPGSWKEDPIRCHITHHCLSDSPWYEALSYVWGDPSKSTPIGIDDGSVNVTENLKSALLHLRSESEPRVLWIDAICINQENDGERAQQVSFMRHIYQQAARSVVWLGSASADSNGAISTSLKLAEEAVASVEEEKVATKIDYKLKAGNYKPKTLTEDACDSVERLLERPWFTRIWIIQEVAVAKEATIVCGKSEIDWATFNKGIQTGIARNEFGAVVELGLMHENDFLRFQAISAIGMKERNRPAADDLLYLLSRFRYWNSTDPRDKVFALLGLVNDGVDKLSIHPEYTAPVDAVYKRTATAILSESRNLDILGSCLANAASERGKALPTWVPDWSSADLSAKPFNADGNDDPTNWTASKHTAAVPEFSKDEKVLGLSGYILDKVLEVGDTLSGLSGADEDASSEGSGDEAEENTSARASFRSAAKEFRGAFSTLGYAWGLFMEIATQLETFVQWERIARVGQKGTDPSGEDHRSVYWQTLCAGSMPDGYQKTEEYFNEWYKCLGSVRRLAKLRINKLPRLAQPLALAGYVTSTFEQFSPFGALYGHALYRRLARTERGYLCLVPSSTQVGDSIGLMRGGKVPLVISPAAHDDDGFWKVVGEGYVHGIMRGEAFDEERCKKILFI